MIRLLQMAGSLCLLSILPALLASQEAEATPASEAWTAQEVSLRHGDHLLAGTLFMPSAAGRRPAIVLLAGSGATDRTSSGYFPLIQPAFLEKGIAVLVYDKPGVGASTGDWRTMALRDRAEEALAAVRFLRQHPRIRADQVGLWGGSQGGWVAPLAASLSRDVAFVIAVSAPGVPPAEQDVYGLEQLLRRQDLAEEVVQKGVRWGRQLMEAAARGDRYPEVRETLLEPAEGKPWSEYFTIPDAAAWDFLASRDPASGEPNVLYDPAPVLARTTTPLLAIFGEKDDLVPVDRSVEIFEDALQRASNPDFTVAVFPEANHGILVAPRTFAPGYLDLMAQWISDRAGAERMGRPGPFTTPIIVFLNAPPADIDTERERYAGDDFYVVMDDLNWYRSEAYEYLERQTYAEVVFLEWQPVEFVVERRVTRYAVPEVPFLDAIVAYRPGCTPRIVRPIDLQVQNLDDYFAAPQSQRRPPVHPEDRAGSGAGGESAAAAKCPSPEATGDRMRSAPALDHHSATS